MINSTRMNTVIHRSKVLWGIGLVISAACGNSDIGKSCNEDKDCTDGLICDIHDHQGTCQEPHSHEENEGSSSTSHEHESDADHPYSD